MSHFIRLNKVSFSYDQSTFPVLKDVSICFDHGWTAISGINGSGKTTLLNLLVKNLLPDCGVIETEGSIGYLAQNHLLTALEIDELRYDYTKKAIRLKSCLELDTLFERPFLQLSFGEQKRMCLAFLLRQHLDVLIVDEPTNHADIYTKNLVLNELKKFSGIGILVSHDRQLLNELAQKTAFIDNGRVIFYDASFAVATAEKQVFENHQKAARQNQVQTIKKQARSFQQKSETVSKKAKCLSKKAIDKKDHDQKEKINRRKLFGADKSDSRAKKVFKERLNKSILELAKLEVKKEYRLGAFFDTCVLNKPLLFKEQIITKNEILIEMPAITLKARSPIAIVGKNGSGKTTLLRHLASICPLEKFTFIPQELNAREKQTLLSSIESASNEKRAEVLSLVRRLGSNPSSIADGFLLSPGLWQKLALALAVVESHPLLMMDEPTNHMDLLAIQLLEEALKLYQGAALVISHDQEFLKNVCVEKIELIRNGNKVKCKMLANNFPKIP